MNTENPQDYLSDIEPPVNFGYELASPLQRLGAAIVDGIILAIPSWIISWSGISFFSDDFMSIGSTLFQTGLDCALGAVFYSLWSGNLGHKLFGMKVISSVDGSDQKRPATGALREGLKGLLGLLIIPSIWLLWDDKKQNLYDKVVNTLVVMEKK